MRRHIPLLILLLVSVCHTVYAQTITITTTNTPSICYNDGTLTVNASGGTGPYIDSIISGPTNPNLTYPIALPSGQNHFIDLPHGTFTIRVHDAAGNAGTFTAVVGGTYVFPSMTLSQSGTSIIVTPVAGTGRPPLQYAISSTGPNSGFGPYQSAASFDTFSHLCRGTYWVRMRDSCGNIFTDNINLYYQTPVRVNCVNFDAHTATISSTGVSPLTYHAYDQFGNLVATNTTGIFSNLPPNNYYTFGVTDSCGVSGVSLQVSRPVPTYKVPYPFDSTIRLQDISGNYSFPPYIFTCLSCVPVQADTLYFYNHGYHPVLFRGILADTTYVISFTDGCGGVARIDTISTTPALGGGRTATSCNSMQIYFTDPNGVHLPASMVDSVHFWDGTHWISSIDGIFTHLPAGSNLVADTIIGYLQGGIQVKLTIYLQVPFNLHACATQHMDSSCNKIWNVIVSLPSSDYPETFYLIGGLNDTIVEQPPGPGNGTYMYGVHPGNYLLVSDSGCSAPVVVDTFKVRPTYVVSYVNCQGISVIKEFGYDTVPDNPTTIHSCGGSSNAAFAVRIFRHDSLVYGPDSTFYNTQYTAPIAHYIYPTDTGFYTYKVYWIEYGTGYSDSLGQHRVGLANIYDTLCPTDTGSFYVTHNTVPFPYVQTAYKCNGVSSGPPLFTIYGGSIPYTVQIPGVDTILINTNTGVFPTNNLGTYNVIAYDNCGISRSFTFTIADTCNGCGTVSAGRDTAVCTGGTVQLQASPQQPGGTYLWSPGGETTQTITVSPATSTTYGVIYSKAGCSPAIDSVRVTVLSAPTVVVADTSVCAGRSIVLTAAPSVSGGTYLWSPGSGTTQSITVSPSATTGYKVSYTVAGCGTATDSATVFISQPSSYSYSQSICTGSSIVFHGQTLSTPGVYYDTLINTVGCDSIISLTLNITSLIPRSLSQSVCSGSSIVFNGQAIGVAGTYLDTLVSGSGCDTIVTLTLTVTPPLSLGLDRSVCMGDSIDFHGRLISAAGVYRDTLTGQGGCDSVVALTLTVHPRPVAGFTIQPMGDTIGLGPIVAINTSLNSDSVLWLLNGILIDLSSGDTLPITTTGNYCIRLIASTALGCTDTSQQCFYVVENAFAMPNAFSPNGDGVNDLFYPVMIRPGLSVLTFRVYNRWGQLVHDDPSRGWDGKYKGAAQPQEAYTYFLSVELDDTANPGKKKEVKREGNFMLFR